MISPFLNDQLCVLNRIKITLGLKPIKNVYSSQDYKKLLDKDNDWLAASDVGIMHHKQSSPNPEKPHTSNKPSTSKINTDKEIATRSIPQFGEDTSTTWNEETRDYIMTSQDDVTLSNFEYPQEQISKMIRENKKEKFDRQIEKALEKRKICQNKRKQVISHLNTKKQQIIERKKKEAKEELGNLRREIDNITYKDVFEMKFNKEK